MRDLYHGEFPVNMTPAEAREYLAVRAAMTDPLAEAIAHFDELLSGWPMEGQTRRHTKLLVEVARMMQPTGDLVEAVARILAPPSWAVMDRYLKDMLREYKGRNVTYDPDAFKHKESMSLARAVIPIAQAPVLAQIAEERRKSEALAAAADAYAMEMETDELHWCQRLRYGTCQTRSCLMEGGWKVGDDLTKATCRRYELSLALAAYEEAAK